MTSSATSSIRIELTPQNIYALILILCAIVGGCVYVALMQANTNTAIRQLQRSQAYQQKYLYAIGSKLNVMPPPPDTDDSVVRSKKRDETALDPVYAQDMKEF